MKTSFIEGIKANLIGPLSDNSDVNSMRKYLVISKKFKWLCETRKIM